MRFVFCLTRFDFRRFALVAGDQATWDGASLGKQVRVFGHGAQASCAELIHLSLYATGLQIHILTGLCFHV